ncbi:hypothetical protein O3G_MSEX014825 [Manduca sexta]|nr:hypothetical protein O3G_MSEX014825 [Manduca sexta]
MVSVTSCQGWEITTIEEVGNRKKGYHVLQKTLADCNGSQCGYCSPAWVMAMYSLMHRKEMTMLEIEQSCSSNICRCTGYRPIIEALNKFAIDAPKDKKITDIEDLHTCKKTGNQCSKISCNEEEWCMVSAEDLKEPSIIKIHLCDGKCWYRVCQVNDIFTILHAKGYESYMLVCGNTAKGVSPIFEYPQNLIDISGVHELKTYTLDQNLIIGAGLTLSELKDKFEMTAKEDYFEYLKSFCDHLKLIAHIPVRNLGSVGGNLMIKHSHNDFPSDLFLLFATVGAQVTILSSKEKKTLTMKQFLKEDMKGKVILNVMLPPLNNDCHVVTYKIMARSQSSHAIVNAGFMYKLDGEGKVKKCRIIYGGLSPAFIEASSTKTYLIGKKLFINETLQRALKILENEIVVTENQLNLSVKYRKQLALGLFYKSVLSLCPISKIDPRYRSGATKIHETRPVSQAHHDFNTNTELWPLNQPIPKVEALVQCAGEAKYVDDIPCIPDEVYAALVLSTVAVGDIVDIDAKAALEIPGVVAFYSAKDIPGQNTFTPTGFILYEADEEIFCSGRVKYYNQPIGMIVAETRPIAERAAKLVQATYRNVKKPILDIKDAKKELERNALFLSVKATDKGSDVKKMIKGNNTIYGQYHNMMETLVCVTKPTEEGLALHVTSQWIDGVQMAVSRALNINCNKLDINGRRLGGSFGFKISRSILIAVANSLATLKLNRPCRLIQSMSTNMRALGKRFPSSTEFEVAVNSAGEIQYMDYSLYEDNGHMFNEKLSLVVIDSYNNCYDTSKWNIECYDTLTDTAKNTWCRAPGTLENIAMTEHIMEQISYEMSKDPLEVRLANLDTIKYGDLKEMAITLTTTANYSQRKLAVKEFNSQNRWKKRGLGITMMRWPPFGYPYFDVNLSVFKEDGTVTIMHGGTDVGQGLNTKAVQICAYILKIPIEKIQIKPTNTNFTPNSFLTGASITSHNIGIGVRKCCEILLERLNPIKSMLDNPTWEQLIKSAFAQHIDLQVHAFVNIADVVQYNIFGIAIAETEVDVLTGEMEIRRVDILQDVGQSVNPEIDIGQVEGAFMMGVGYWTCENLVYDKNTGELLTDRSWHYLVPLARDIPQDFRVSFRKNSYSSKHILGAKGTGEPPLCLAVAVPFSIRAAIAAAREDSGIPTTNWFQIDGPYTVEKSQIESKLMRDDYPSADATIMPAFWNRIYRLILEGENLRKPLAPCVQWSLSWLGCEVSSDLTLVDYLRDWLELRGTKYMCREGGCGACIVAASKCPGAPVQAVNSCMVSVTSCQGWEITTIEEVGNRKKGYHELQKTLADSNGSQCGYCSPAWVMAMYSLIQKKKDMTMLEIEQSFGSNVCRCTGYRPILEAFKKFAIDATKDKQITDIEDLQICKKTGQNCSKAPCNEEEWCMISADDLKAPRILKIKLKDGKNWYRVCQVNDIFTILNEKGYESYMLVFGNTAKGAYPIFEYPRHLIDISAIEELKTYRIDQNLIIGAGLTLTELRDKFDITSKEDYFGYLKTLSEHLKLVAHIPVRNLGSVGGNLMIKHAHNEFSSDLFLLCTTVGAQIVILTSRGEKKTLKMKQFLKEDMKGKVILQVMLPPLSSDYHIVTYKVMPRAQSAHAIVNAGFMYKLDGGGIVKQCRIVYGGLSSVFITASKTKSYLIGKNLFTNETLQGALNILENELVVTNNPPEPSVDYRKQLALGLFYKSVLSLCPTNILGSQYRSGATKIHETRPVSESRQMFDTNTELWPLNQPIPKVDALVQCAGEAKYVEDIPTVPDEVHAALVLSTVAVGDIVDIDASAALEIPGVIAFYSAKDIPGQNTFTPTGFILYLADEEIFCSGKVKYYNQPIGMIVAETRPIAERAAKLVQATYRNVKKPVLNIKDAKKESKRNTSYLSLKAATKGFDVKKVIKGENAIYGQYHYMMETLVSVTTPTEEGLALYLTTHWIDGAQMVLSRALNLKCNKIDIHVRRLGGSFGIKISRSILIAVASSLATLKLNKPCRLIQPMTSNMRALGKRFPCSTDFQVAVNSAGVIQYMDYFLYEDNGHIINEKLSILGVEAYNNCYDSSKWNVDCYDTITDTAKTTWCRAPGTLENIAMIEQVMEQISYEMDIDPLEVRLANLDIIRYSELKEMTTTLTATADYAQRKLAVKEFNAQNRWKKRGIGITMMKWTSLGFPYFDVTVSVFHEDGSVAIIHGGIDMGQGVNTKAVQICAYILKIPIEKIQIKATNSNFTPNNMISGGSLTSQNIAIGVKKCCEELLLRLTPIKIALVNPTWEELIATAFAANINLQVHSFVNITDIVLYNIFGMAIAETEVDVLTGEMEIRRVDILQDVGQSVSPEIDIGQVEGAFMMGVGYWTCENLVYDKNSGELLTDRSWNYSVPLARDIPQDFRVSFRKNSYSNKQILGSKGTGEPPICLAVVVPFSIRAAIAAAREDSGIPTTNWFQIDGPYTVEKNCLACNNKIKDFKLY